MEYELKKAIMEYMLFYLVLAIATIFYGIKFYDKTKVIGE